MRIEIAPQILFLNSNKTVNKYTNIRKNDGSLIDSTITSLGDAVNGYVNLANQKKLIRIFKGNSYLTFTYDATRLMFVSEAFRSTDSIYIKYVEQETGGTDVDLKLNVVSGYEYVSQNFEGELSYLKEI